MKNAATEFTEFTKATQFIIHWNIERYLKKSFSEKFGIGDKVLLPNPMRDKSGQFKVCDPFQPLFVVGEISAKLPGGIYKVMLIDGNEVTQKGVYEGEMVLLTKSCNNHDAETSDIRNQEDLINALCDYTMSLRRNMYWNKRRRTASSRNDTSRMFSKYCITLDCRFLAELLSRSR